jgi:hypothetical protein
VRSPPASTPKEDVEDWTQDLLIHLRCLPAISKHRQAGKEDIVQTFDPHKHYGANTARFFNYINLCLGNKFRTIYSKRMKNPLCRPGNLSLSTHFDETHRDQIGDEFCHSHSHISEKGASGKRDSATTSTGLASSWTLCDVKIRMCSPQWGRFQQRGRPAIGAELLGTTEADFCRMRSRLRQLGRCFLKSEPVPKQRRPYRRRVKRTALSTPLRFRTS